MPKAVKKIKTDIRVARKPRQKRAAAKVPGNEKPASSKLPGGMVLPAGSLSAGGGFVGGAIGSMFGAPGAAFGSAVGRGLGAMAARLVGTGAYTVKYNTLVAGTVPSFSDEGRMRFKFREYLGDITSAGATFTLASYAINPGVSASFPQLSVMASLFRKYRFHGLVYEFKTSSATAVASTNTALGVVIMATEYDVQKSNFTTKQQMEDYMFASSTVPSSSVLHAVECRPDSQYPFYILRSAGVPSGYDAHLYDLGKFEIATVGQQASSNVGELWVTYDVEFAEPVLPDSLVSGTGQKYSTLSVAGKVFDGTVTTTGQSIVSNDTISTMTFLVSGDYLITVVGNSSVGTLTSLNMTGTATFTQGTTVANTNIIEVRYYVRATAGQTVIFTVGGTSTVATYVFTIGPFSYTLAGASFLEAGEGSDVEIHYENVRRIKRC